MTAATSWDLIAGDAYTAAIKAGVLEPRGLASRAGMKGVQERLSLYYKSPMAADGLQPEHDLFIQQTKLKNTLRHVMGEAQVTHVEPGERGN